MKYFKIIWNIFWSQKRQAELKSNWASLVRWQKLAWESPIPLDCFFILLKCESIYLSEKYYLIMGLHGLEEHKETPGKLGCFCIGLYLAVRAVYEIIHTRLNHAFRSVFRFVSDNISDSICIVCTQTAFFIQRVFYQKAKGSWWFSDNSWYFFCVVCTGP